MVGTSTEQVWSIRQSAAPWPTHTAAPPTGPCKMAVRAAGGQAGTPHHEQAPEPTRTSASHQNAGRSTGAHGGRGASPSVQAHHPEQKREMSKVKNKTQSGPPTAYDHKSTPSLTRPSLTTQRQHAQCQQRQESSWPQSARMLASCPHRWQGPLLPRHCADTVAAACALSSRRRGVTSARPPPRADSRSRGHWSAATARPPRGQPAAPAAACLRRSRQLPTLLYMVLGSTALCTAKKGSSFL